MNNTVFITNGDVEFNQLISTHLLNQNKKVSMEFRNKNIRDKYIELLDSSQHSNFYPYLCSELNENSVKELLFNAKESMGSLDILIIGNELIDEEKLFEEDPIGFGEKITTSLNEIYLYNKNAISFMAMRKNGQIILPLFYDSLSYLNYSSSPILNHAKISMMKCLSKEISAFNLSANTITFGYYDDNFDKEYKKQLTKKLNIFGLKVKLKKIEELLNGMDILLQQNNLISGQNIHITKGIETTI